MRRIRTAITISLLGLALLPATARPEEAATDRLQYPLGPSRLTFRPSGPVRFRAQWTGPQGTMFNPTTVTSAVAIRTDGERTTTVLDPGRWRTLKKGRGFRYADRNGRVQTILVRLRREGGRLKLGAALSSEPSRSIELVLTIGSARWCAELTGPFRRKRGQLIATSKTGPASCPCAEETTSTWAAIQTTIFTRYGCTSAACHGGPPSPGNGSLDLRPEVAFQNLVAVPSTQVPALQRVKRADRTHSLLWLKLAMKTAPEEYAAIAERLGIASTAGSGMPLNAFALTPDELEAVRLWIQNGAPENGVVDGTARLLSTCLPPPDPIKITPPPVPAASDGVQFHAPPWTIEPRDAAGQNGEDEVCYATYYDFADSIPASMKLSKDDPRCRFWTGRCTNDSSRSCTDDAECPAGGACQSREDCFFFNRNELTQDPNSHHSIIHIYRGEFPPGSDEWMRGFGPFACRTGERAGQACDPLGAADQCSAGACAGRVQSGVACIGYGPRDYGFGIAGNGSVNSPSIGGSQQPYAERSFPPGVYGVFPVRGTMVWNSHAFNVTDRPTTNEQYLNVYFAKAPEDRRDILRGIFDARNIFVQNVPPFEQREYCATFTLPQGARVADLSSHTHKRGVLFRIWTPPNTPCANVASCGPDETRPPLVSTTIYNDPIQYDFSPPLALDGASPASRTIRYCSVFDNGFRDPATVKRRSTSPVPPIALAPGGPCAPFFGLSCLDGPLKGEPCNGDDRSCDSAPGAGDGRCDACPLRGGVTTEDEMFILLGSYY
jgi:hypothetical protein